MATYRLKYLYNTKEDPTFPMFLLVGFLILIICSILLYLNYSSGDLIGIAGPFLGSLVGFVIVFGIIKHKYIKPREYYFTVFNNKIEFNNLKNNKISIDYGTINNINFYLGDTYFIHFNLKTGHKIIYRNVVLSIENIKEIISFLLRNFHGQIYLNAKLQLINDVQQ